MGQKNGLAGWLLLALLWLTAAAMLTGVALLPFYSASPAHAYASVAAIEKNLAAEALRAMHHWASAMLLVGGVLYIVAAITTGFYQKVGKKVWIGSVLLVVFWGLTQLTGHALPWDQQGVQTVAVETGIAENAPVIGALQAKALRGGAEVGPQTFNIWFGAHVVLLTVALLVLCFFLWKRIAPSFDRKQLMKPLFAVVPLLILSAAIPPPLTAAATTADFGNYGARPEWYILPLHTLLEAFQSKNPKLAFIGTMVIPGIILVVILGLPWFDKKPRTPTVTGAISLVAAVGLLASVIPSAGLIAPVTRQPIVTASNLPASNKPAETFSAALVAAGQKEYTDQGCSDCHKMDGKGETNGPDLTHEATRHADLDWQMRHLRAPKEVTPGSTMPPFARIGDEKIKNLAIYLISKK